MIRPLHLSLVCPRFEPVTAVGAEVQIKTLAALLAARGHRVEVLTTCVRDTMTWKNHYHPGLSSEGPLALRRFPVDPRPLSRHRLEIGRRIRRGESVGRADQEEWFSGLGFSSALRDHIARNAGKSDAFIFSPALAGTTWGGMSAAGESSILLPALPDLPASRLELTGEILGAAAALLAGSEEEAGLIAKVADLPRDRILLAGAACADAPEYDAERFRRRHGLEVPFLFTAGRRSPEKGVNRLVEYVATLVRSGGLDLRLVVAGEEPLELPRKAGGCVLDLHFIEDRDKADGMAAALAYCQPSSGERLALAPMEAWLARRPVLAEAGGAVTRERCRISGGGLWYRDFFEFEESVRFLLENEAEAAAMGLRGGAYVRKQWSWEDAVVDIERACRAAAHGRGAKQP